MGTEGQADAATNLFSPLPQAILNYNQLTLTNLTLPAGTPSYSIELASTTLSEVGAGATVISGKRRTYAEYERSQNVATIATQAAQIATLQAQVASLSPATPPAAPSPPTAAPAAPANGCYSFQSHVCDCTATAQTCSGTWIFCSNCVSPSTPSDDSAVLELTGTTPALLFGPEQAPLCSLTLDTPSGRMLSSCEIVTPSGGRRLSSSDGADSAAALSALQAEVAALKGKDAELQALKQEAAELRRLVVQILAGPNK